MSSEEMRVELEAFVNVGLREGWSGWPLKEASRVRRTSGLPLHPKSVWIRSKREDGLTGYGGRLWVFGIGGRYRYDGRN